MVRAKQNSVLWQRILGSVSELETRLRGDESATFEVVKVRIESDFSQSDHDLNSVESGQFAIEKGRAAGDLLGRRLILRRSATHSGRDVGIGEPETIIAIGGGRL